MVPIDPDRDGDLTHADGVAAAGEDAMDVFDGESVSWERPWLRHGFAQKVLDCAVERTFNDIEVVGSLLLHVIARNRAAVCTDPAGFGPWDVHG